MLITTINVSLYFGALASPYEECFVVKLCKRRNHNYKVLKQTRANPRSVTPRHLQKTLEHRIVSRN
jgi:hypothetical protein